MSSEGATSPAPVAVSFRNLTKRYQQGQIRTGLSEAMVWKPWIGDEGSLFALDDVTFDVPTGQTLGIIGPNGAGKSTLLKALSRIVQPTSGSVRVEGRLAAMIELAVGFDPDLTGWENLRFSAHLLGLDSAEVRDRIDDVVAFAGIPDMLDMPVRHLSTGMRARLGFSLATHLGARVLAVDEALAVGDREFQTRCIERIATLRDEGCTILFVSHDLWLVDQLCDRVVALDQGRLVDDGEPRRVIDTYLSRRARPIEVASPSTLSIDRFEADAALVRPDEPLGFRAEVVVPVDGEPVTATARLHAYPGEPFARDTVVLAGTEGAGRHDVHIALPPIPITGGEYAIELELNRPDEHAISAEARFAVDAPVVKSPMWRADSHWELTETVAPVNRLTVRPPAEDAVVIVEGASKVFTRARGAHGPGRRTREPIVALDGVSFDVAPGEAVGLVGPNGSGKSTLLKLVAGVTTPTTGSVTRRGRVASLIELGVGFDPDLTGVENVHFAGALLGLTSAELDDRYDRIVADSGIGSLVEMPVRTMSSGMRARLGFALATNVDADLVLIDEVLSVGDADFRDRAFRRVRTLREQGTAIMFVSHDLWLVGEVCERVLRIDGGQVLDDGPSDEVITRYGGTAWSSASSTLSGVRMMNLKVTPDPIEPQQPFEVEVDLVVEQAAPHRRLELHLRRPMAVERRRAATLEEIGHHLIVATVIDEAAEAVSQLGSWSVRGHLPSIPIRPTSLDIVMVVFDESDGTTVAETWRQIDLGAGDEELSYDMQADWRVVRLDDAGSRPGPEPEENAASPGPGAAPGLGSSG